MTTKLRQKFHSVITAIVTPFKNGRVDYKSLEKLTRAQMSAGVGGLVINGTTGESPTLEPEEREEILGAIRSWCNPETLFIMGTGSNCTIKTIKDTQRAQHLGAHAALVVVPYYNKPPQRGLAAHFRSVADATDIPLILYNVPSRTITSLELDTIKSLANHPRIIGIKEASGKIEFAKEIAESCPEEFLKLSGDDSSYCDFLNVGGQGVISVASHIMPREFVTWTKDPKSREGIEKYKKLIDLLFCESNPIPIKKALQLMGLIESAELRLPLCELDSVRTQILTEEMKKVGIL